MKLHCPKDELLKGVQLVQNAVSPRSTLPVLSNILFECENNRLRLSSTDLEIGIRCTVKADIDKPGSVSIPAKTIGEFLRMLDADQELDISVDGDNHMEIKAGKDRCVIAGLPKDDYPVLPDFTEEKSFSVKRSTLKEMIKKTSFAVSTDETRYVLNGVDFIIENGKITTVATDGRRLACINRNGIDKKTAINVVIPSKAINELARVLSADDKEGEDKVQVSFTENQITFKYKDTVVISRLIEGNFPNFEQVIPKSHKIKLNLPTKKLLSAIQKAAVGTIDKGGSVKFSLSKGKLSVSASAQGRVEVESELEVNYQGESFEIAFNPNYAIDALKSFDTEEVHFELTSALNPGVLYPAGDNNYSYVIMPMRLS